MELAMGESSPKNWDAFVSYASDDKADEARPIVHMLDWAGFRVWFDEFALRIGDSVGEHSLKGWPVRPTVV